MELRHESDEPVEIPSGLARMVELGLATRPVRPADEEVYEPMRPLGGSSARELTDFVRGDR